MTLEDYKYRWDRKPILRTIYRDLYRKIENATIHGSTLEIGGGIGNLNISTGGRVIKSDIQYYNGVNVVADAQSLPFSDNTFSNIVLFDVLHHLQCPLLFIAEAQRVLKPGGRVIMIDPGITPVSGFLYKIAHDEPVDMEWDMTAPCKIDANKDPYESNQAIPTILFKKNPQLFLSTMEGIKIIRSDWLSLFAYPLSGGFKSWSLLPNRLVDTTLKIEDKLLPFLGDIMAFRLMVVLEVD